MKEDLRQPLDSPQSTVSVEDGAVFAQWVARQSEPVFVEVDGIVFDLTTEPVDFLPFAIQIPLKRARNERYIDDVIRQYPVSASSVDRAAQDPVADNRPAPDDRTPKTMIDRMANLSREKLDSFRAWRADQAEMAADTAISRLDAELRASEKSDMEDTSDKKADSQSAAPVTITGGATFMRKAKSPEEQRRMREHRINRLARRAERRMTDAVRRRRVVSGDARAKNLISKYTEQLSTLSQQYATDLGQRFSQFIARLFTVIFRRQPVSGAGLVNDSPVRPINETVSPSPSV